MKRVAVMLVLGCGGPQPASDFPARRATLLAQRTEAGWRWDIRLQGDGETVFLDL